MKTSLKKITLFGDKPDVFMQRIITQDVFSCKKPKLSAICSAQGKVKHLFWLQHHKDHLSIWIDQSDAPHLLKTIQYYDPFHTTRFDLSNSAVWANESLQFSSEPIEEKKPWKLFLIQNELLTITDATRELYTPHMLKLDEKKAISLKKGCFIGHEIISRVHFRGKTKKQIQYKQSKELPETKLSHTQHGEIYHYLELTASSQ